MASRQCIVSEERVYAEGLIGQLGNAQIDHDRGQRQRIVTG
jgi:hypothetical protein